MSEASSPPTPGATSCPAACSISPRLMKPLGPSCHATAGSLCLQSFLGLLALICPCGGGGGGGGGGG
eukprot:6612337-Karenia_brevis.AAC.1